MRRRWFTVVVFLGAALAAYHNCFSAPFVFDDVYHIVDNERIRLLWPVWPILRDSSRPLVQLSLATNFAISGLNVWSYHLFNVLVHVSAALALNAVIRRTLQSHGSKRLAHAADQLALTTALLWMLHPLQTSSVTYIIQRGESLMGLFCLLTLYFFIRSIESMHPTKWRVLSVFCCGLGLASKPIMGIAPLLVLLYDRFFIGGSFAAALHGRGKYYAALFGTLALLPVMLAGNTADWASTAGFTNSIITPLEYAATQPSAILRYLRLSFWPDALCLDYGWQPEQRGLVIATSTLAVFALVAASIWGSRRSSLIGYPAASFFVVLAPTSSVIPIADLVFEHRMYLPLAAVLSVVVTGGFLLVACAADRLPCLRATKRSIIAASVLVAVTLLGGRTMLRNDEYASDVALWSSAVEVSPRSPRAQYNLGTALMKRQRFAEATVHLKEAVKTRAGYTDALYNLGNAQLAQGQLADAVMSYRQALSVTPDDWQMHNNLGVAMLKQGDVQAAARAFERTLELEPHCVSARSNLYKISKSSHPL